MNSKLVRYKLNMRNEIATVNDRLQNEINKLRTFGACESFSSQVTACGTRLLGEVFLHMPINELENNVDQGIELATLLRIFMDGANNDVLDARIEFVKISNSNSLRKHPHSRFQAYSAMAKAFLVHGMMEEFAACTEAVGDAQKQLGLPIKARDSYRKADIIRDRLGFTR